jgi:hypothetical protein
MYHNNDYMYYNNEDGGIDYEFACRNLVPHITTHEDLEAYCYTNGINRNTWKDIYCGLMTLNHFGKEYLETTCDRHNYSVIIEDLIKKSNQEANEKHRCKNIADTLGLVLVPDGQERFEVFNSKNQSIGHVAKILDFWIDNQFNEFPDCYAAALSYVEFLNPLKTNYNEFGW